MGKNISAELNEEEKREARYSPPLLSNYDETVPKTHIGMYSIFRNPKNINVFMEEEPCQNLRKKTFDGILALYLKYGGKSFADFWNVNREEINYLGLNSFAGHPKIAPIAGLVECFEKVEKISNGRALKNNISFGINRELLNKYFENVKIAELNGTELEIPRLRRTNQKNKNIIIWGEEKFYIEGDRNVHVERCALYRQFKNWCTLQGVSEREGILMALECLIKDNPAENLREIGQYHRETIFDKYYYIRPEKLPDATIPIKVDGAVLALAEKIVERYNYDPHNNGKPKLDIDLYFNNALHLLNAKMPLKYRDPEAFAQKKELERIEEYNE